MERVQFIDYGGTEILYLDFSNADVQQVLEVIDKAAGVIRARPTKSMLTLTYTDKAKFDGDVIKAMKEFAKGNEPHVKAAAIVGIKGLQKIILDAVSLFSKREFGLFEDIDEAKRYLLKHA